MMATLSDIRRAGPCHVTVVHTYWPPAEYARLGFADRKDLFGTDPQVATVLEREIRARVARHEMPHDLNLEVEAAWGPIQDTLNLEAREEQADLLIVGTRQPHGWDRLKGGSTALGTLRRSRNAVLCVPARTAPPARSAVPPLRTILVATDFSDLANAAIPYAYSLLRGAGGKVELCHVHEHDRMTVAHGFAPPRKLSADQKAALEGRLRALIPAEAERLDIASGVNVVEDGSPAEVILQTARRIGADAITLGSHGRSGLARTLLGSAAESVLRGSDRPVFIVRPPAR
jgi:nucleotide-binding universal stress UspA family protein